MVTAKNVAEWMFAQFETATYLFQESVVYRIRNEFGAGFVYNNKSGNLAIGKDVLREFRKISEGKVVWERGDRAWRILRQSENYQRRQID